MGLKICMVTTSYPRWKGDYSGIFIHNLAKHLVKLNHRVFVISPFYRGSKEFEQIDGVKVFRFKYGKQGWKSVGYGELVLDISLKKMFHIPIILFFAHCLRRILTLDSQIDFDVIHANFSIPTGLIACATKKIIRKPVVVHLRYTRINDEPYFSMLRPLYRYTFSKCDDIIANGSWLLDLVKKAGIKRTIGHNIPNGVDKHLFHHTTAKKIRNSLLFVGHLSENKGVTDLLEAFRLISTDIPGTELHIYGTGPMRAAVQEFASRNRLRIFTHGIVSHEKVARIMNRYQIFVLPSIAEGTPNVVLEAMACGLPVVATRVGGIPDLIENGRNGILVEPEKPIEIANAVLRLLRNRTYAAKLAREARFTVESGHSWEKCALRVANVYRHVLS